MITLAMFLIISLFITLIVMYLFFKLCAKYSECSRLWLLRFFIKKEGKNTRNEGKESIRNANCINKIK